ncbi:2OG-Fe(II) oxygenase [Tsukamurella paurometabola]|uniref:Fe(II)-dependent oxygenase superfamily protein n=1 Tax=Tsukamurella paurometabola TaxID=2061 RepID=A0A3P8LEA9_TSUPA|nr:2OG-Fe(II) oxygenase [Tsukamurella paurometabola]UEA81798.1 2OG-Fe(II) oxygenase [Tsukamurella paurometabola]VDR38812.1 Fe(II)-dependent oxygenase superfamily protein [Tsukamurella paurometabola]
MIENEGRPSTNMLPAPPATTTALPGPKVLHIKAAMIAEVARGIAARLDRPGATSLSAQTAPDLAREMTRLVRWADERHFHTGVTELAELKALTYDEGDFMRRHTDNSYEGIILPGMDEPVGRVPFATQLYLSEPGVDYEGGELVIGRKVLQPGIGDVVVLRGDVPHEVRPITSGTRIAVKALVQVATYLRWEWTPRLSRYLARHPS